MTLESLSIRVARGGPFGRGACLPECIQETGLPATGQDCAHSEPIKRLYDDTQEGCGCNLSRLSDRPRVEVLGLSKLSWQSGRQAMDRASKTPSASEGDGIVSCVLCFLLICMCKAIVLNSLLVVYDCLKCLHLQILSEHR